MSGFPDGPAGTPAKVLSFRGGWWVIVPALGLLVATVAARLGDVVAARDSRAVGDGRNPETYGFDLSTCLIPRDRMVGCGLPKDGLPVLDHPPTITAAQADEINRHLRGKFLVPADRVIGLKIAGQAQAYPLRMLNWHEVVNDSVGGVPIAVTYHPLCDSVVVFDRRVGGETLRFGFSGLLYNSNALLYDRRPGARGESLWSQLQWRAVAGPAAEKGLRLERIAASLVCWEDWRARHPDTKVLKPEPRYGKRYRRNPYGSYYGSEELKFPVDPLPPADTPPRKTRVLAVKLKDTTRVFPLPTIAARADADGVWRTELGGRAIQFAYRRNPPTAFAECQTAGTPLQVTYAFWFAWYAAHPGEAALAGSGD